ncbi:YvcK family protein [Candidatus Cerribacteria bacterium 'Amazon FNV 2010 28 9']|uniref:Putative gluconeogenesis factor n=1 Tax=Candidatus Cerribacteria bacterium 'Amazon FNV 2010 28 9' TaxID=2081795 RepID=A0A317JTW4_9BACT|nr:MAG: YvcK family protein [Candidatus Cerribacteria bacterium 'Amazon FNV 2010 28 9']
MPRKKSSIVVIGGGTGTYTLLSGLRDMDANVTALMTMVDDGGSNRILRDEFGLLPTSGVRLAMVALSAQHSLLRELFLYRFHKGTGISGMTFGNLFLAAVTDIVGTQKEAIEKTCQLLSVRGTILPISYDDVRLVATYENGHQVIGEHMIDEPHHDGTLRITNMTTIPKARISKEARAAIFEADLIVLGPGDFYTNTVANLVVEGVADAINGSKAKVVFVSNLMTKYGEAYNYTLCDYITDLSAYMSIERLDAVLVNTDTDYSVDAMEKYKSENSIPVVDDTDSCIHSHIQIVRLPLSSHEIVDPQKGDLVKRSMIRHDSQKLAKAIMRFIQH